MQEYDNVKLVVEREEYAQDGVYKGMYGWICDPRNIRGTWLVNFPQYAEFSDIATICVREEDLVVVRNSPVIVNEAIRMNRECPDGERYEIWEDRPGRHPDVLENAREERVELHLEHCTTPEEFLTATQAAFGLPAQAAESWEALWEALDAFCAAHPLTEVDGWFPPDHDIRRRCCTLYGLLENLAYVHRQVVNHWN